MPIASHHVLALVQSHDMLLNNHKSNLPRDVYLSGLFNLGKFQDKLKEGICEWCKLQVAGIKINLFQHSEAHSTPDAVFPNNWFSTHPVGEAAGGNQESTLVFYPMKCPNR